MQIESHAKWVYSVDRIKHILYCTQCLRNEMHSVDVFMFMTGLILFYATVYTNYVELSHVPLQKL